jgi:hypothetical protein
MRTDDPTGPIGDTTITPGDLLMLGAHLLNICAAADAMGHVSPVGSLCYISGSGDRLSDLVLDIFETCQVTDEGAEAARARVHDFLDSTGWLRRTTHAASNIGELVGAPYAPES